LLAAGQLIEERAGVMLVIAPVAFGSTGRDAAEDGMTDLRS
jgi:hypothetical protein